MVLALAWGGGLVLGAVLSRRGLFGAGAKALYGEVSNKQLAVMFACTTAVLWVVLPDPNRPLTKAEKRQIDQNVFDMIKETRRQLEGGQPAD